MKKTILIISAALLALCSCSKEAAVPQDSAPKEIVLNVASDQLDVEVSTKVVEAITSMPSTLYWSATSGAFKSSESSKWSSASASVSSNTIATGKYQTATATSYNYYVANQAITFAATGSTLTVANNSNDIIAGCTSSATTSTTPSVSLNHVFARTGTLTCNTQSGYTISGVSWKITGSGDVNGTAGTYNIATGSWTAASTKLSSATDISSSSDMYLIPGTYTMTVTYTLSKGGSGEYSQTFTKSGSVTLVQGKVNNLTCTAIGGNASDINISVSLEPWGTENINFNLG